MQSVSSLQGDGGKPAELAKTGFASTSGVTELRTEPSPVLRGTYFRFGPQLMQICCPENLHCLGHTHKSNQESRGTLKIVQEPVEASP